MGQLIDSSVFIAAERGDKALQEALGLLDRTECFLSAVTVAELLHGVYRAREPHIRTRREAWVEGILREIPTIPYDGQVARVLAPLDAAMQTSGNKIATSDLIIAATAIAHGHSVMTRDQRSFPRVPDLVVHVV